MEKQIARQYATQGQMSRAFANLKKRGPSTVSTVQTCRDNLQGKWKEIRDRHDDILELATSETKNHRYITETSSSQPRSVLLFPAVNNYRRYLIHQTCEEYRQDYDVFTFSIGQGLHRRTVICFKSQLVDSTKPSAVNNFDREKTTPFRSWRSGGEDIERTERYLLPTQTKLAPSTKNTRRDDQTVAAMGVERHLDSSASASTRLNKSNSVDIYRPPALRRHGESVDNENYFQNKEQHHSDQQLDLLSFQPKDTNCISAKPLPHPLKTTQNYCSNADTPASVTISTSTSTSSQRQVRRERRPDRAVYVPRARRSLTTPPAVSSPQQLNIQPHNQQQTSVTTTPESRAVLTSSETTSALKGSAINITSTTAKTTENCKSPVKEKCSSNSTRRSTKDRTNGNIIRKEKSSSSSSKRLTIDENEKNCFHKNNSINNQNTNDQYLSDVPDERRHMNNEPNCNDKNALLVKDCDISNPKELSNSTNLTNIKSNVIKPASDVQKVVPKMNTSPRDSLIPSVKPENVANLRIEDVLLHEGEKTDKCDRDAEELLRASKEINRSNRRIFKQTFNSDILEIPEKVLSNPEPTTKKTLRSDNRTTSVQSNLECNEASVDEDDWDAMYDESGDCIDPKILQELTAAVGQVKIELPKMDYSAYLTKQSILNDEEFPHVLEVSNFPVEFKNQDLLMVFSQYKESGFDIKWVDDTHALAVFSSSQIAAEVLAMGHPFVVLKPLADATVESRLKAKKCSASLQPYRPRPETCAALARRLVTGALGVRLKTAAQEREIERRVLREAKERKLLAAKQRDEMWES